MHTTPHTTASRPNYKQHPWHHDGTILRALHSLCRQRQKQLDEGMIPPTGINGLSRQTAIAKIKNRISFYATRGHKAEINHVILLWDDIEALMPGAQSHFQAEAAKLRDMMAYARQHHSVPVECQPEGMKYAQI